MFRRSTNRRLPDPRLQEALVASYVAVPVHEPEFDLHQDLDEEFFREGRAKMPEGCMERWLESPIFQGVMAMLIVANAAVIGCETDMPTWPHWDVLEDIFLVLFTCELMFRFCAIGKYRFFACSRDLAWNLFDLLVVALGVVDTVASALMDARSATGDRHHHHAGGATTVFRIVRLLRILRIFKIIRFLKQLYLLAYGLAEAAQAVFWVSILMTFVLYVCAILLVRSVGHPSDGEEDSHSTFLHAHFGDVPTSMLSLFILMASPNLPDYAAEAGLLRAHPQLTVFLIVFVIFGSFGMIALLTGVISESMFEKNQMKIEEERVERESMRKWMQDKCKALFQRLKTNELGQARTDDVINLLPLVQKLFDLAQVDYLREELFSIVRVMDTDGSGSISEEEFCHALVTLAAGVRAISLQELYHLMSLVDSKLTQVQEDFAKSQRHSRGEPVSSQVLKKVNEVLDGQSELRSLREAVEESLQQVAGEIRETVSASVAEAVAGMKLLVEREREPARRPPDNLLPSLGIAGPLGNAAALEQSVANGFTVGPFGAFEGFDAVFRERMVEVMRAQADALSKVVALEAQAMVFRTAPFACADDGAAGLPPAAKVGLEAVLTSTPAGSSPPPAARPSRPPRDRPAGQSAAAFGAAEDLWEHVAQPEGGEALAARRLEDNAAESSAAGASQALLSGKAQGRPGASSSVRRDEATPTKGASSSATFGPAAR